MYETPSTVQRDCLLFYSTFSYFYFQDCWFVMGRALSLVYDCIIGGESQSGFSLLLVHLSGCPKISIWFFCLFSCFVWHQFASFVSELLEETSLHMSYSHGI